jgi:hypothetical protein
VPNFLQDEGQGRFAAIIYPEPLFLKAGQFHIAPGYSEADDHSGFWKTGNNWHHALRKTFVECHFP